MMPVDFEGSNITMQKPSDMTDEQCMPLKAMKGVTEEGFPYFVECWKPNKEDMDAIAAGRPVYIQIISTGLPPVAMWTMDENNRANV